MPQGRKKRFGHCTGGHYPNTLSPVKTFRQNFFRKLLQKDGGEARQASPPLSDVDLVSRVLFFPASREGRPFLWGDGHPSPRRARTWRSAVATYPRKTRPGPGRGAGRGAERRFAAWSCCRWGLPCRPCHQERGALLPHPFTLASGEAPDRRSALCCTFRRLRACRRTVRRHAHRRLGFPKHRALASGTNPSACAARTFLAASSRARRAATSDPHHPIIRPARDMGFTG